jgi:hypothetical protein
MGKATIVEKPKRRCLNCKSVLSESNQSEYCRPCSKGEYDIPDKFLALVEDDDGWLSPIANILRKRMLEKTDTDSIKHNRLVEAVEYHPPSHKKKQ